MKRVKEITRAVHMCTYGKGWASYKKEWNIDKWTKDFDINHKEVKLSQTL